MTTNQSIFWDWLGFVYQVRACTYTYIHAFGSAFLWESLFFCFRLRYKFWSFFSHIRLSFGVFCY
jgi:hypothetical protein